MRIMVCVCLSLGLGCGAYVAAAVIWAAVDPQGAGLSLLFTIPVAIVAAAVPALLGMIVWINRCDWQRERPARKLKVAPTSVRPMPTPAHADDLDDLELTFA